jgi:hypothetical protein
MSIIAQLLTIRLENGGQNTTSKGRDARLSWHVLEYDIKEEVLWRLDLAFTIV